MLYVKFYGLCVTSRRSWNMFQINENQTLNDTVLYTRVGIQEV